MTDLRTAAQQALEDICGARLCEVNSMSSRREALRLLDKAADALRAALVEPEQDRALQWGAAPARIEFGSSPNCWREAFLPLGKDNTLRLLAETEALPLVENALRAALAQQAEPTGKDSLQVEPTVAENATTQQQIEDTPPSEYRRGYWDGFNIGKREGRIEAEDAAQQAEPVQEAEELKDPAEYDDFAAAIRHNERVATRRYDSVGPVALETVYETIIHWDEGGGKRSRRELATRIVDLFTAPPQRKPEPMQEPVAWMYTGIKQDGTEHGPHLVWKPEYMDAMSASKGAKATPLYTAPPQRKPLTDEEILRVKGQFRGTMNAQFVDFARAVERAHGIGGQE